MGDQVPDDAGNIPSTQDDIAQQAQLLLRAKNIKEFHSVLSTSGSLTFPNGVAIDSGVVVTFKNKGLFDGNWIIQKVIIHLADGKLMTEIEFRKCLDFSKTSPKVVKIYNTQTDSGEDGGNGSE